MNVQSLVMTGIFGFVFLVILSMWGCPQYHVYDQKMEGEAQLAHAEYSNLIKGG